MSSSSENVRLLNQQMEHSDPNNRTYTALSAAGEPNSKGVNDDWGGTPGLRKMWATKSFASIQSAADINSGEHRTVNFHLPPMDIDVSSKVFLGSYNQPNALSEDQEATRVSQSIFRTCSIQNCISGTPGLIIAVTLNLFLSMSFGQAFFPSSWDFPSDVPRAIGVQMFLFSTFICQLIMTVFSEFPTAMGMMMVENIPFMHIIAETVIDGQGMGKDAFATVLAAFAISSVVVGVSFYLLGKYDGGSAVYFFPRHVIIGCIGGIGIFITQTGVEVATNQPWIWTLKSIYLFVTDWSIVSKWLGALAFEILLRIILALFDAPLFPPFYFVAIAPTFWVILLVLGEPIEAMRVSGWFFDKTEHTNFLLIWELLDFSQVNWALIGRCVPTMVALTIFR